jgi:hypothetical protein
MTEPDRQDGDGLLLDVRIQTARYAFFRLLRANAPHTRLREEWSKLEILLDSPTRDGAEGTGDVLTYDEKVEMLRLADDIAGAEIADFDTAQSQVITRALRVAGELTAPPKPAPERLPTNDVRSPLVNAVPVGAPQLAPDAVREALHDAEETLIALQLISCEMNARDLATPEQRIEAMVDKAIHADFSLRRVMAFLSSAPVPRADSSSSPAFDRAPHNYGERLPSSDAAANVGEALPSPAVAAEPVADDKELGKRVGAYLGMSGIDAEDVAYLRNLIAPPVRGNRDIPQVQRIECVKFDYNLVEVPDDPVWRLKIGGICADFPTETWANNFRNAILSLPVQPGAGERERDQFVDIIIKRMNNLIETSDEESSWENEATAEMRKAVRILSRQAPHSGDGGGR